MKAIHFTTVGSVTTAIRLISAGIALNAAEAMQALAML